MTNIPFSVYDFFAYLASGSVVLFGLDLWIGPLLLDSSSPGIYEAAIALITAYVFGQATAQVSKYLIEDGFVRRVLLPPSKALMGNKRRGLPWLFPGYYKPLPTETQARIRRKAQSLGVSKVHGEALFLHAYALVTQRSDVQQRLDAFRNLYGFARNMVIALTFTALAVEFNPSIAKELGVESLPLVIAVLGLIMFYRYLKFYRQYTYQLLITYAEARPIGD